MRAVGYQQCLPIDHADALAEIVLPTPQLRPRDLLVRVEAVSVNPVDTKLRLRAPAEPGQHKVLGFDAAGVVHAVGSDVSMFKVGDEVYYAGTLDRQGSNAELQLVDERIVAHKPKSLSYAAAAALPLTTITAWELLFARLSLHRDSLGTILVVGGAGGVGSLLIQLARKLTNLTVLATASRSETRDWCSQLGAHHVLDHSKGLKGALQAHGIFMVDYAACLTATDQHWPDVCELIAPQGKIALIDDPKQLDIMPLKRKSVSVHWEFMFTRPLFQTADMIEQHRLLSEVAKLVDSGVLRSTLSEVLGPLDVPNLRRAHQRIESGRSLGKLVLEGIRP